MDNDEEAASDDAVVSEEGSKVEDDDTDDIKMSASPDAETTILFTKPSGPSSSGSGSIFFQFFLLELT